MRFTGGMMEVASVNCPVCLQATVTMSGCDASRGPMVVTLHFLCNCSAMFVYEFVRSGAETLFNCKLV